MLVQMRAELHESVCIRETIWTRCECIYKDIRSWCIPRSSLRSNTRAEGQGRLNEAIQCSHSVFNVIEWVGHNGIAVSRSHEPKSNHPCVAVLPICGGEGVAVR